MTTPLTRLCVASQIWLLSKAAIRSPFPSAKRRVSAAFACAVFLAVLVIPGRARDNRSTLSADDDSVAMENSGAPVEVDGRPILLVYTPIGGFTPQERAEGIEQRIIALSSRKDVPIEAIHAEDRGTWSEVLAGSDRIMAITETDAKAAERARGELAAEYTEVIREVVSQYRQDHTWKHLFRGFLYAALATGSLVGLVISFFLIRRRARSKIEEWLARREVGRPTVRVALQFRWYLGRPFVAMTRALFWILLIALLQSYVTLVLRFFPSTKYTSNRITGWLFSALGAFGKNLIGYIPNLMLVALISLVTAYLIKVSEYIFREIRDEKLSIQGFYPDWAEPTAKLVRFLILAAAAVVIFPYLPGSESPAFKGMSVFLGVLLSLGSTSAMAHGVAGTILTYMRAFQMGDFVRIGDETGEVIEKNLLVTRICTQKNEVVTIPNGTVLGGVVINYSAQARHKGVIFHTTATIGYNAPWRQVHELLLSAALATDGILHEPQPFVLQTALNDFYVAYELNAYTADPQNMQYVYSLLHQNIQDKFNEAGVEINSPHYTSLRDGNQLTIPESYWPSNYKSPVFEVREVRAVDSAEPSKVA